MDLSFDFAQDDKLVTLSEVEASHRTKIDVSH